MFQLPTMSATEPALAKQLRFSAQLQPRVPQLELPEPLAKPKLVVLARQLEVWVMLLRAAIPMMNALLLTTLAPATIG